MRGHDLGRESRQDSGASVNFKDETYTNEYSSVKRSPEDSGGTHCCDGFSRAIIHGVSRKVISRAAFYLRQEDVPEYLGLGVSQFCLVWPRKSGHSVKRLLIV